MASNTNLEEELLLLPDYPNSVAIFPTDEPMSSENKQGQEAEKKIYQLFKKIQRRMTVVWSVSYIMIDRQHRRGEVDFIIIHPKYGIHILEVKGYKPSDLKGRPQFLKDAQDQLVKNQTNILQCLKHEHPNLGTNLYHVGTALILPNLSSNDKCFKQGIPLMFKAHFTCETDDRQSTKFIAFKEDCDNVTAFEVWLEKTLKTWDIGFPEDVAEDCYKAARGVLVSYIQRPVSLVEDLSVGEHLEELTKEQAKYLLSNRDNPTVIISGVAGTGKTILVVIEVLDFLVENQHYNPKVLYIVHNDAFCEYVKKLFNLYYIKDKSNPPIDGKQLMKQINVITFKKALENIQKNDLYDMIVVDEAQEILTDWNKLEFIENLRSKETGLLRILYDENQGNLGLCLPLSRTIIHLPAIVRNTSSIALLSTLYASGFVNNNTSVSARAGRKPEIIYCSKDMDILEKCIERLDTLADELKSKKKPTNVALLTNLKDINIQDLRKYPTYTSMIKKWELAESATDYARKCLTKTSPSPLLVICPYSDFGGMEADIIIMLGFNLYFDSGGVPTYLNLWRGIPSCTENFRNDFVAIYTAITRAKSHMIILFNDDIYGRIGDFYAWLEKNIFKVAQEIERNAKPDIQNIRRLQKFSHIIVNYRNYLNKIIPQLGDLIYAVYHPISGQRINFNTETLLLMDLFEHIMPETYYYGLYTVKMQGAMHDTTDIRREIVMDDARYRMMKEMTKEKLSQLLQDLVIFYDSVQRMKNAHVLPSSIITEDKIDSLLEKLQKQCHNWVRERYPQYCANGELLLTMDNKPESILN